jgi:pullulanase/glycogen debranching enzyme
MRQAIRRGGAGTSCLRQHRWLTGEAMVDGQPDVVWWHPAGRPMRHADWESKKLGTFGLQLAPDRPAVGKAQDGETLLCLINRDDNQASFLLPAGGWQQICDSSTQAPFAPHMREISTPVVARSVQILSRS